MLLIGDLHCEMVAIENFGHFTPLPSPPPFPLWSPKQSQVGALCRSSSPDFTPNFQGNG